MYKKNALIIGSSEYTDTNLSKLRTPDADVNTLASVLQNPEIGGFDEVLPLLNQSTTIVRRAIARFFTHRNRNDLLLLYFSGHGVRDDRGDLYLAVQDTEHNLLSATAIPASFITQEMDRSNSRRQVLILDCCHSGAFAQGAKSVKGASVGTASAFEGTGYGRIVLTATDSTQYAWEGDQVLGEAEKSVFTHYLIKGLQTGEADADADGKITLSELYEYVYAHVVTETPRQTPGKWTYKQQGEIVIALNPNPIVKPVELPDDLKDAIADRRPFVREGAVRELENMLYSNNKGEVLTAKKALEHMVKDDSRRVSELATEIHSTYTLSRSEFGELRVGMDPPAVVEETIQVEPLETESAEIEILKPKELITVHKTPAFRSLQRSPMLLSTIGWTIEGLILSGIFWLSSFPVDVEYTPFIIFAMIIWGVIASCITGFVIREIIPNFHWNQVFIITFGWILSIPILMYIDIYYGESFELPILGGFILGGIVTSLVIRRNVTEVHWKGVTLIAFGWGVCAISIIVLLVFQLILLEPKATQSYSDINYIFVVILTVISCIIGGNIGSGVMYLVLRHAQKTP